MADVMSWDNLAWKWFLATLAGCVGFALGAWLLVHWQ